MIKDNSDYVYDAMGNAISVIWENTNDTGYPADIYQVRGGFFKMYIANNGVIIDYDSCRNILELSREIHADLWQTIFVLQASDAQNSHTGTRIYGSKYPKENSRTLKTLTVTDIKNLCDTCQGKKICRMKILW